MAESRHFRTVVVGGGQTGLAVGYYLAQHDEDFVIIDASRRTGDAWRSRWDSLTLFTPARFNGLPGMPFPAEPQAYVSKDEVADYLEEYAKTFDLPTRTGIRVERLTHDGRLFRLETGAGAMTADNVIVAMADYQVPRVPAFAKELGAGIVQLHSSEYRNLSQLRDGPVLIVGFGNSGAEIGMEVAGRRETYISGEHAAVIPFRLEKWFGRNIGVRLVRFGTVRLLNTSTPIGRRARPRMVEHGSAPLVRVKPKDLLELGVKRVPRITGVRQGLPETADGQTIDVANVIWCTGFEPSFSWIDIDVFDDTRRPRHRRGIVDNQPGLYFCGLFFLHALWSETLTGVAVDARHIVNHLVERDRRPAGTPIH